MVSSSHRPCLPQAGSPEESELICTRTFRKLYDLEGQRSLVLIENQNFSQIPIASKFGRISSKEGAERSLKKIIITKIFKIRNLDLKMLVMERDQLLKKTTQRISRLPDHKLKELAEYVEFLLHKDADKKLVRDITDLASSSKSLDFLEEEEELYGDSDITENY